MERRQFLRIGGGVGLSVGTAGCASEFAPRRSGIEVSEFEVWNEDDEAHAFDVSVFVAGEESVYERTVELDGAPGSTFTREVLPDAPETSVVGAEVAVGDRRAREDLTQYDESVAVVSLRCSSDGEVAVAVYP